MFSDQLKQLVVRFKTTRPTSNFKRWERQLYQQLVDATSHLSSDAPIKQRLWHVEHDQVSSPVCIICNKCCVTWDSNHHAYRKYCGVKCALHDPNIKASRAKTMMDRYGTEHYTTAPDFNKKRQATYMKNYGVSWSLQSPKIRQQITNTVQQRYGVSVYTQSDDYKLKNTNTLTNMGLISSSQSRLSPNALLCLSDRNWIHEQHCINKRTITDIAKELDVDATTVMSRLTNFGIELVRFGDSQGQRDITEFIKGLGISTVVSNTRSILPSGKELDIFVPSHNVAIEYCGLYWHSADLHPRMTKQYHKEKMDECSALGIRLITIFEDEWIDKKNIILSTLRYIFGGDTSKINARSCTVKSISNAAARDFLDTFHIQGDGDGSIRLGLFHDNDLVAVCKIIQQNKRLVINRYATKHVVRGGFSKTLAHLKNTTNWEQIVTFADQRWSTGELYGNTGFLFDKYLPPDYYYVKGNKRIHKFNFRHSNLPRMISNYDSTKTEVENCLNNGLFRIWDCGKIRFVMNNTHVKKSVY